jgi:hypothetical protein
MLSLVQSMKFRHLNLSFSFLFDGKLTFVCCILNVSKEKYNIISDNLPFLNKMSDNRFTFAVQRLPAGPSYTESFQDQAS